MTEFLISLQESDRINSDAGRWCWDANDVAMTVKPCPLAEFLEDKLQRQLSSETRHVLKVAACLGSHLNEQLLEYVLGSLVAGYLQEGVEQGTLVLLDDESSGSSCAFAHDHAQHAVYGLITERELFHVEVGRRLWRKLGNLQELDRNLFVLLPQFNVGKRLITREAERALLATLCLHAGQKAAKASSFRTATVYLELGISLVVGGGDGVGQLRGWRDQIQLDTGIAPCCRGDASVHSAF
jgi:predicted ATPase